MLLKHLQKIKHHVYLDNNATTALSGKVLKRMTQVLKNNYGNSSSLYKEAIDSAILLDDSRKTIAKTINAQPSEIYFTGSATESNNTIIKSLADKEFSKKSKIIATPIEHASVISTLEYLKGKGYNIHYTEIDEKGKVVLTQLEESIDEDTILVCCVYANNETGVIQELRKITNLAHQKNVPVFADCVQALGKIKVDVLDLGIDYASFSAHKIHGPKGSGLLYVKNETYIQPLIHGGHQESGIRAGTESIHNIVGFAEACKAVPNSLKHSAKIRQLKNYFIQRLKQIKPDIQISSPEGDDCLPNTANIIFPGISNAHFMAMLNYFNIAVSAGSACNTQANEASHVLKAIGLSNEQARESIRFSLGISTTKSNIDYVLNIINKFISGKLPAIGMLEPNMLDKKMIYDTNVVIFDIRFWHDRLSIKGIPNSYEVPFFSYKKYIKHVPKNKKVIIICQGGYISPAVAYEFKFKGYKDVSFLIMGIQAWKRTHPELYKKLGGKQIQKLK